MIAVLQAKEKSLVLGGDGRCDSPGFSAKYGAYSFMELEYNAILNIELVQVSVCVCVCVYHYINFIRVMKSMGATTWRRRDS